MSIVDHNRNRLAKLDAWDVAYYVAKYVLLVLLVAMILIPVLYVVSVSFRPLSELFAGGFHFITRNPTLDNWMRAWENMKQPLINSAIISTGTMIFSLLIVVPGAYVFGRKEFPGKKWLFRLIIVTLLFPYILLTIPIMDLWNDLGLFNTIPGLWIAFQVFVTPFALWILRDFFANLPSNLEEAAQVYGCSQFSAFLRVILPLSAPAVVAVGFLAFLVGWNNFLFPSFLTTGTGPRPAVVQLYVTTQGSETTNWGLTMTQTLLVGIPPAVLYMIARRYLTSAFVVD
jgi:multiple sugar transport system permease protein